MKLISDVEIKGFRSIRDAQVKDLGDFTALAGLNNSGKSSILRALSAFFTGNSEPGRPLEFENDYHRQDRQAHKKKRIRVGVTFTLPVNFKFPKKINQVAQMLGGDKFRVTKEWAPASSVPQYYLNDDTGPLSPDQEQQLHLFLQLITFRYIPNRVLPIDVIRAEHRAFRDVLIRRLRKRLKDEGDTFTALRTTSVATLKALAKRFRRACPMEGEVRLATPTSWDEIVFTLGYRLVQGGVEIEDDAQGSGVQSLLMLETLLLIDRDYFQRFGWRQAAIWAVEEPESSLHASLEAQVAFLLATTARDSEGRLQVLATTHSDLVVQQADAVVVVCSEKGRSTTETGADPAGAVELLSRMGVSRWVHPLLHHPLEPLVLVEGKFDKSFWDEALRLIRPKVSPVVTYLETLSGGAATGGVENTIKYIKDNVAAIRARGRRAPVVLVLDWDAWSKIDSVKKLFGSTDPFLAFAWPESAANPILDQRFRGLERFFPTRIIEEAENQGAPLARQQKTGRYVFHKDDYSAVKAALSQIAGKGLEPADLEFARPFMLSILKELEKA